MKHDLIVVPLALALSGCVVGPNYQQPKIDVPAQFATQAQLVIVHHGLLWDSDSRVIDRQARRRLQALFDADLTLAAYKSVLHPQRGIA